MKKIIPLISIAIIFVIIIIVFLILLINSRVVTFDKTIKTKLTEIEVWQLLETAFTDSSKVFEWPRSELIKSSGLRNLNDVQVTYKVLGTENTYNYTIYDVNIGQGFKYKADDNHPLLGGGEITLVEGVKGTNIRWQGTFALQKISMAGFYLKYLFINQFFDDLQNNLSK